MIIDAHAHVSPTTHGSAENYLEQLRGAGIQRGVICPGGMIDVRKMNDYIAGKARPDTTPKNDYVERSLQDHPELLGVACVNPLDPQAVDTLEALLQAGRLGLMISPLVHPFSFTDALVAPLASLCGEREVPIYSHVAFRRGADSVDYIELARRFPRTNFILEHIGLGPADEEATAAAAELDNFFVETSMDSYLHVLGTVKRAGASKVIFGSEYPLSHPALELTKVLLLPISDGEREKILGGNIRQLLRLGGS